MNSTPRRTVVIVDDHPDFLASIRKLLQVDFDVLAALDNGQQGVAIVSALKPDVVVLDVSMPVLDGFAVARRLRERGMQTGIVFLTAIEDPEYALAAHALGASLVVKRRMHQDLVGAIRTAADISRANRASRQDEPDAD